MAQSDVAPASVKQPVRFVDLTNQHTLAKSELQTAILRVLNSQQFILGSEVEQCERSIASHSGAEYAIGCASGTDALLLSLMALEIGPGDEVITSPYSFFATASSIWRTGAQPVFADIEPDTFNLDPESVESVLSPRTRAIVPVHLFGHCADMDTLNTLASAHQIPIIEDAAQAFSAEYNNRRAGSLGTLGAFSFFPTKNLGAMGDAGAITTSDATLAKRLQRLRVHGMEPKYYHSEVGLNSRLDAIQAAVISAKLPFIETWTQSRRDNAEQYHQLFRTHDTSPYITLPLEKPGCRHVWNQYVIRVPQDHRDALKDHLHNEGIGCEIYYPIPLHQQPCFSKLGYREGSLPISEQTAKESLALPIHPDLTIDQQDRVVSEITAYFDRMQKQSRNVLRGPAYLRRVQESHPVPENETPPSRSQG